MEAPEGFTCVPPLARLRVPRAVLFGVWARFDVARSCRPVHARAKPVVHDTPSNVHASVSALPSSEWSVFVRPCHPIVPPFRAEIVICDTPFNVHVSASTCCDGRHYRRRGECSVHPCHAIVPPFRCLGLGTTVRSRRSDLHRHSSDRRRRLHGDRRFIVNSYKCPSLLMTGRGRRL